jgi:hypothetical protein
MVPVVRTKQGLTEGFSEGEFQIPGVSLPNRESVNAVGGRLSPWLKGRGSGRLETSQEPAVRER